MSDTTSGGTVKFEVKPEAVNKMVAEAIIASELGSVVRQAVEAKVKELCEWNNSPIKAAVNQIVGEEMLAAIRIHCGDQIKKLIAEKVTGQLAEELVNEAWKALSDRIRRSY